MTSRKEEVKGRHGLIKYVILLMTRNQVGNNGSVEEQVGQGDAEK